MAVRTLIFSVFLSCSLTCAAVAQELAAPFDEVGRYEIEVDAEPATLVGLTDRETGQSTVERSVAGTYKIITITGFALDTDGSPAVPVLTITLGPYVGDVPEDIAVEYRDAERVLMANIDSETTADLTDITLLDDGSITFGFTAELAVMAGTADGANAPVPGAAPATITGRFTGIVPIE